MVQQRAVSNTQVRWRVVSSQAYLNQHIELGARVLFINSQVSMCSEFFLLLIRALFLWKAKSHS